MESTRDWLNRMVEDDNNSNATNVPQRNGFDWQNIFEYLPLVKDDNGHLIEPASFFIRLLPRLTKERFQEFAQNPEKFVFESFEFPIIRLPVHILLKQIMTVSNLNHLMCNKYGPSGNVMDSGECPICSLQAQIYSTLKTNSNILAPDVKEQVKNVAKKLFFTKTWYMSYVFVNNMFKEDNVPNIKLMRFPEYDNVFGLMLRRIFNKVSGHPDDKNGNIIQIDDDKKHKKEDNSYLKFMMPNLYRSIKIEFTPNKNAENYLKADMKILYNSKTTDFDIAENERLYTYVSSQQFRLSIIDLPTKGEEQQLTSNIINLLPENFVNLLNPSQQSFNNNGNKNGKNGYVSVDDSVQSGDNFKDNNDETYLNDDDDFDSDEEIKKYCENN